MVSLAMKHVAGVCAEYLRVTIHDLGGIKGVRRGRREERGRYTFLL